MAENLSALDFYVSVAPFISLNGLAYLCEHSDTQNCSKCASLSRHFVKLSHTGGWGGGARSEAKTVSINLRGRGWGYWADDLSSLWWAAQHYLSYNGTDERDTERRRKKRPREESRMKMPARRDKLVEDKGTWGEDRERERDEGGSGRGRRALAEENVWLGFNTWRRTTQSALFKFIIALMKETPSKCVQEPKQKTCTLKFVTSCSIILLMIMTLSIPAACVENSIVNSPASRRGVPCFLPRLCDLCFVQTVEPERRRT